MKKRFSNIALVFVAVAAIAFTGCKKDDPKIEGQWIAEVSKGYEIFDISYTFDGFVVWGFQDSSHLNAYKVGSDHYFYNTGKYVKVFTQINKKTKTSGEIIFKGGYEKQKIAYRNLTEKSVILTLFADDGKTIILENRMIKAPAKITLIDVKEKKS